MFNDRGADSDDRIEWELYAFLARRPDDMPALAGPALSNEFTEEELEQWGSNGPPGVALITDPTKIAWMMEMVDSRIPVPPGTKALIVARWAYHWDGGENDYDRLRTLDGLVEWLKVAPDDVVLGGEVIGDVD